MKNRQTDRQTDRQTALPVAVDIAAIPRAVITKAGCSKIPITIGGFLQQCFAWLDRINSTVLSPFGDWRPYRSNLGSVPHVRPNDASLIAAFSRDAVVCTVCGRLQRVWLLVCHDEHWLCEKTDALTVTRNLLDVILSSSPVTHYMQPWFCGCAANVSHLCSVWIMNSNWGGVEISDIHFYLPKWWSRTPRIAENNSRFLALLAELTV